MKDLIYRQDAIDDIKAIYEYHDTVTEDRILDHLHRLPSAQQWIPVSDRLPELKERVLVYAEDDESWYIAISQIIYPPSPKVWFLGFNGTQKVKAWMPLPTPWKGEEQ